MREETETNYVNSQTPEEQEKEDELQKTVKVTSTADNHQNNSNRVIGRPFKKGESGNPAGRPKGSTLKEYQASKFRAMSDEDKEKYLIDITGGEKWRMAEGNPAQTTEQKIEVTMPTPLLEVTRKNDKD